MYPYIFYSFVLATCFLSTIAEQRKYRYKIVGGSAASIEDFPYQVGIELKGKLFCGGTVITEIHILTAAHCIEGIELSNSLIRAGSSFLTSNGVTRTIDHVIYHPDYNHTSSDYDAAILVLSEPLTFSSKIQPIKLPDAKGKLENGQVGVITGWGHLYEDGPKAKVLQKVAVPVIPIAKCITAYKNEFEITARMFCAGYLNIGGRDACQGDSGGPFNVNHTLWGITSWGIGCAEKNYPGVYVLVPLIRNWIDKNTKIS